MKTQVGSANLGFTLFKEAHRRIIDHMSGLPAVTFHGDGYCFNIVICDQGVDHASDDHPFSAGAHCTYKIFEGMIEVDGYVAFIPYHGKDLHITGQDMKFKTQYNLLPWSKTNKPLTD